MASSDFWESYPNSYRETELQTIAKWVLSGDSGSVVGLIGCGRSHLLSYLCHRPDAFRQYLPPSFPNTYFIPVDLYNLPSTDLSTLYRTILHAFYWVSNQFDEQKRNEINRLYLENRSAQDPFLPQMALYELLRLFQNERSRVVLVFNRFDRFCEHATPEMANTLRGLRDAFRETLCYVMGMLKDVIYLDDPFKLGDLYELLVGRVCWVGQFSQDDAYEMLAREFEHADLKPSIDETEAMLRLSGRFPSLLKGVAQWWEMYENALPPIADWEMVLLREPGIHFRLDRMLQGLTQEEQQQLRLVEFEPLPNNGTIQARTRLDEAVMYQLAAKGLCRQMARDWCIDSRILARYIDQSPLQGRGRIWLNEKMRTVIQDDKEIELAPMEFNALRFFIQHPHAKHTIDKVIDNTWPEEDHREGITNNALHVQIRNIRRKIEPDPAQPKYLITWHGRPGGYIFYPEGKPI